MVCPRCGSPTPEGGRCVRCGVPLEQTTVATGVIPIDTTGLPAGATFEPRQGVGTGSPTTLSEGSSIPPDTTTSGSAGGFDGHIAREKPVSPLAVGHSFGPRYHVIKLLGAGGMGAVYHAWDS